MKYAVFYKKLDELNGSDFDEEVLNQYENLTLRKEGLSYTVNGQEVITTIDSLIQDMSNKQIEYIFDAFVESVAKKLHEALEQEQKRGKWENVMTGESANFGRHLFVCSECHYTANYFVEGSEEWWDTRQPNYCPYCGARMESDEQ